MDTIIANFYWNAFEVYVKLKTRTGPITQIIEPQAMVLVDFLFNNSLFVTK